MLFSRQILVYTMFRMLELVENDWVSSIANERELSFSLFSPTDNNSREPVDIMELDAHAFKESETKGRKAKERKKTPLSGNQFTAVANQKTTITFIYRKKTNNISSSPTQLLHRKTSI